ncbi:ead/Ea22-like family protein [Enterobacter bugandensis]|uniref:ead/Ea22-like family protein n=1 Tax=Enterobacter bugandensis TaxID=881260 RepID=UPI003F433015
MSNIDKRALREAAKAVGKNDWQYVYTRDLSAPGRGYITVGGAEAIYCLNKATGGVKQSENVLRYIAAASPATVLALLDEIAELEQGHCGAALLEREESHVKTVGKLLDELEAAEKRIAEMQALASGVKQFSEFQICHYGATEDYAKGYIDCQNNYNKVLFAAAGKGEAS